MNTSPPSASPEGPTPRPPRPVRKGFRLYKRRDNGTEMPSGEPGYRERPFYFKFDRRAQRYTRCLDTTDAAEAQQRARKIHGAIVRAADTDRMDAIHATRLRHPVAAKISELFPRYDSSIVVAGPDTRGQNKNALLLVVSRVQFGDDSPENRARAGALPLSALNGLLVKNWFALAKRAMETCDDPEQRLSLQTTANSRMAQARSLFAPRAVAEYQDTQEGARPAVWHDCLAEFHAAFNQYKFSGVSGAREYHAPDDAIIHATLDAWEKLENRNLFLAIGHELAFGLRAGETAQVKWSWWKIRSGYPVLDGLGFFKNKQAVLQVRALDPFFTTLRAKIERHGWRGQDSEHVITGPESYRTDGIAREVSAWMRALGWNTKKTNHALRAYGGSQIAMKFGPHEAQAWLRHSSVKVTEDHYLHFVKLFKPADLDTIPVWWALAQQTPHLRIVQVG